MNGKNDDNLSRRAQPRERFLYLPEGISQFESLGVSAFFAKNHVLLKSGETPDCCYAVKSGRIAVYEISPSGEEQIYHIQEPGSLALEPEVMCGSPLRVSLKMLSPGELIRIEKDVFLDAILRNPKICMAVMQSISLKFFSAMQIVREKSHYDASQKICSLLFSLADYQGDVQGEGVQIREKISQQMISSLLGLNRITTVRTLASLREQGLVDSIDGRFNIRDSQKMRDYLK